MSFLDNIQKQLEQLQKSYEEEFNGQFEQYSDNQEVYQKGVQDIDNESLEEIYSFEYEPLKEVTDEGDFKPQLVDNVNDDITQVTENDDLLADFEARKAVIYAEIINPKYF